LKVSIIGGGGVVGSSAAYRIAQDGWASEIILVDIRRNMAEAHALDIDQAMVYRTNTRVRAGGIEDTKNSDVVLIAVGAIDRPSHSSRAEHFEENIYLLRDLLGALVEKSPFALWMIATVPVDTFVYLIHQNFSIPRNKIIGLNRNDTSRFRWAISKVLNFPALFVEAFVLGEHGETMVPIFSQVRVKGKKVSLTSEQKEEIKKSILDFLPQWNKLQPGRTAGWTTAESVGDILKSMVSSDGKVWPCSTPLKGEYGLEEVSLGVPIRMGSEGVKEIIEFDLESDEKEALKRSAELIRKQIILGNNLIKKS